MNQFNPIDTKTEANAQTDAIIRGIVKIIVDSFYNVGSRDMNRSGRPTCVMLHVTKLAGELGFKHVTYNMFMLYRSKMGGVSLAASSQAHRLKNQWLDNVWPATRSEYELDLGNPHCIDELITVVTQCGGTRCSPSQGRLRKKLRDTNEEDMLRERPARISP